MDCSAVVMPVGGNDSAIAIGNGVGGGIFPKAAGPPPFSQRVIASMARDACRADGACPAEDDADDEAEAEVVKTNNNNTSEEATKNGRHGSDAEADAEAEAELLQPSLLDCDPRVRVLPSGCQLRELHTLLRDRETSRSDFVFYADRLIRLVVEEALNCLPYEPLRVTTPGGQAYDGLRGVRGNCGISVMRSGEAMEKGLRDCCRAIRIGKMLIQREDDASDQEPQPIYVKLPPGVQQRRVLLMQPVLGDGRVAAKALQLLTQDYRIPESNIFLLNIFSTRSGLDSVLAAYPKISVLTSEVHDLVPYHFCARYFGTD